MTILARSMRREQVIVAIGLAVGLTLCFYATDLYMAALAAKGRAFWSPALAWDFGIPLKPAWIWVYLFYFPACFLPLVYPEVHEHIGVFRRVAIGFLCQFMAALAFFWIAPSRMMRTPFEPAGVSEWALVAFYQLDQGFNIFPSLHVANVAFIACLTWSLRGWAAGAALWLLCLLIAASTLLVKQHYLVDLPAGAFLGALCYYAAFSSLFGFLDRDESKPRPRTLGILTAASLLALALPAAAQTERPAGGPPKAPPSPVAAPAAKEPLLMRWMIRPFHRSMLITLPVVETDPNRGVTSGIMPIWVRQGERDDRIRRIHAPSVTYNSIFGVTSTYRYYVYPTEKATFTGFASISKRTNRNLFVRYDDADLLGRGIFVESRAQWTVDGSKRFFGVGPDSIRENQTNYAEKAAFYEARIGVPLTDSRFWRAGLGHRLAGQRVAAGPVDSLPDTARLFPQNTPARWHQDAEARATLDYDSRDHPVTTSRGYYGRLYAGSAQRAVGSEFVFQRYGADLRAFLRSSDFPRLATAVQARFEQLLGTAPFYLMPQLGGKYVHRAYGAGRFVDKGLAAVTIEERITAYSLVVAGVTTELEVAPFAGLGSVFSSPARAASRYARPVVGAAVRAVARPQVVGSIDVGVGQEGPVAFMDINYSF